MAEIMSHKRWMKLTYGGTFSVRSTRLKAVDAALKRYHETLSPRELQALKTALLAWIREKGPAWKTSVRNKYHAVEHLFLQVHGYTGADKRPTIAQQSALREAVEEVDRARREIVKTLFHEARLEWRPGFTAKLADQKWGVRVNSASAIRNARQLGAGEIVGGSGGGGNAVRAARMADSIIRDLVPPEFMADAMRAVASIIPDFAKELAASMTPFVGVILAGGSTVFNSVKAVRGQYRVDQACMHAVRSISRELAPTEAVAALIRILERERNYDAFSASVSLAEFGGKLAGVLVDAGTATNAAIGLASNVVKLTNILRIVVRDVMEKNAANSMMQRGDVDFRVFQESPVVGCYLILCAPTSVLVKMITAEWGTLGWMEDVERMVQRHIVPLQEQARRVVKEHRFVIPSLERHPGVLSVNTKALDEMAKQKGKAGRVGLGPDSPEVIAMQEMEQAIQELMNIEW